jgi:hypothetical protein
MPRVEQSTAVCTQCHVQSLTLVRFSKILPRFTKKSPGQSARVRVVDRATP